MMKFALCRLIVLPAFNGPSPLSGLGKAGGTVYIIKLILYATKTGLSKNTLQIS